MQLDEARTNQLVELVFAFVGINPDSTVVKELIGLQAAGSAPPNLTGLRFAKWLVSHTLTRETADVFIMVVGAVDPGGAAPELHALSSELQADPSRWRADASLGALWAPPEWPFVDRESLRQTLNLMAEGAGPTAVTIEGSLGQGKRTVSSYVGQLATQKGTFRPVVAELRREPRPGVLLSLVEEIRLRMEIDADIRTTHAEPERQAQILARDLAAEAPSAAVPVWLVANIIEPTGIEEGILPFIDELLLLLPQLPELADKLRVLLLTESVSLLTLEHLPAAEHRHVLPDIGKEAVAAWLSQSVPGKSQALYDVTVDTLFRKIEESRPEPPNRLRALAKSCIEAHRRLSRTG